ncbi:MAG: N-acetyltransferase [Planctomycetales bacterium]|nr:N-acetyltransferase [Planctomycetales bacterium]MCA9169493.1 N-acetyltransferase [Planctomycetales bacterium]
MIRTATEADAAEILRIYRPAVQDQVTSLETVLPSEDEMQRRIRTTLVQFPWLVHDDGDRLRGFAYAGPYRQRQAYRWSVEVSIYVDLSVRRQGVGRALYERLFEILTGQGYCAAVAGIVMPNEASRCMHEALGFESSGVIPAVGFKFGSWRDVGWWIRRLRPADDVEPPLPLAFPLWQQQHRLSLQHAPQARDAQG